MSSSGFLGKKGFSEGVLRSGRSSRCLEHSVGEYDPVGGCPIKNAGNEAPRWETDFDLVPVLGGDCACPMRLPDPIPVLDKNCLPIGPEIYPVLGLGSGLQLEASCLQWSFFTYN